MKQENEVFGSWKVISDNVVEKQCDRLFLNYNKTVLSDEVLGFFGTKNLVGGESRTVCLYYDLNMRHADIIRILHPSKRTIMSWSRELSNAICVARKKPSDRIIVTFKRESKSDYRISTRVSDGNIYDFDAVTKYLEEKGFRFHKPAGFTNMIQLGEEGEKQSAIHVTDSTKFIVYLTDGDFDLLTSKDQVLFAVSVFDSREYEKEDIDDETFREALKRPETVFCVKNGNKKSNNGLKYLPHCAYVYSNEALEKLLQVIGGGGKKYSVNDAVWIATAAMAYEDYYIEDKQFEAQYYFKQQQIVKRAGIYTDGKVDAARVSQWCCGDHNEHSCAYLKAHNSDRRLSFSDEFSGEKVEPTGLDYTDKIYILLGEVSLQTIYNFVHGEYIRMSTQNFTDNSMKNEMVYPSLEEYDPGISQEDYMRIIGNAGIVKYNWIDVLYYLYKMGGEATCKQIAQAYGNGAAHYNSNAINIAKAVAKETGCELYKNKDGNLKYWPVLFQGYDVTDREVGLYCYILRPKLREAIGELEKEGYFMNLGMNKNELVTDKNIILYGPPGTGKTYNTVKYAVAICEGKSLSDYDGVEYSEILGRYEELKAENRVAFTTFHQSYGYEEFIEGIKPVVDNDKNEVGYKIEPGVFKQFCEYASRPTEMKVDPDSSIWFMDLNTDKARVRKDDCFKNSEINARITESDGWAKERFVDGMKIGDYVLSYAGSSIYIDAIGEIKSEALYDESRDTYKWYRKVTWHHLEEKTNVKEINSGKYLPTFSIARMNHMKVSDMLKLISDKESFAENKPFVFIIDEINRGNISKIFGELITLIEDTKRKGAAEEMEAILPYSNEPFSVPDNVYILGTMNTADRSIALMDTALRRRFSFKEMMPDPKVLREIGADIISEQGETLDVALMLEIINKRIEYLYDREHTIGHAFFTCLKDEPTIERLAAVFEKSVIPLLQEYFYEDYGKIQLVLGDNGKTGDNKQFQFIRDDRISISDVFSSNPEVDIPEYKYSIQKEAFRQIESYKLIGKGL